MGVGSGKRFNNFVFLMENHIKFKHAYKMNKNQPRKKLNGFSPEKRARIY
jgi:hypothetical protein